MYAPLTNTEDGGGAVPGICAPRSVQFCFIPFNFLEKMGQNNRLAPAHLSLGNPGSPVEYDSVIVFSIEADFVFFTVRSLPEVYFDLHFSNLKMI